MAYIMPRKEVDPPKAPRPSVSLDKLTP